MQSLIENLNTELKKKEARAVDEETKIQSLNHEKDEHDTLGTQLIQRKDDLAKLYENIRIQQSALKKGEAQYADRLRDIQQLSFRVEQLSSEFEMRRAFASRLPQLTLAVNKAP